MAGWGVGSPEPEGWSESLHLSGAIRSTQVVASDQGWGKLPHPQPLARGGFAVRWSPGLPSALKPAKFPRKGHGFKTAHLSLMSLARCYHAYRPGVVRGALP